MKNTTLTLSATDVVMYMAELGAICPPEANPSDFLLNTLQPASEAAQSLRATWKPWHSHLRKLKLMRWQ